ncbi:ATP-binding domain-containing protein [Neobacillus niacini]|uniref:DEAD/DEAH box helicase n=1 Tax=Neobacillus niacini TaxID=86668 RepID=UPI00285A7897|nr:ATP-binding domain-containing protein [Neobacillus niacini]MDR7002726.1 superfamily I DNA and RNA helicase [Neobacillus niacini]
MLLKKKFPIKLKSMEGEFMKLDIVRGIIKNIQASDILIKTLQENVDKDLDGTLFLGYLLKAADQNVITVDALLVSEKFGLVAFIFSSGSQEEVYDQYDKMFYQLENTLTQYNSLRKGRKLAFEPNVITFFPSQEMGLLPNEHNGNEYLFANPSNLDSKLNELEEFDQGLFNRLQEALQKVSTMKPKKDRGNVKKASSLGNKMKIIEKEIANLDQWQKKAAFEVPEGPQRVRGLAGSGKTVVLALKAAYLHAQHPEWDIAVTFYSRALGQQFREMITNFSFEYLGHEPNFKKLHILHSWGTGNEIGIYSITARDLNITPITFNNAKAKYGRDNAFEGICKELLLLMSDNHPPVYDAILIDEAQDLPISFFKICYKITKDPKRIVFAYDELQNLTNAGMPDVRELFGDDEHGNPLVTLDGAKNKAQQDIVLPICYRNSRWTLTLAHALGFGIYREGGLVQLFKDLDLWDDIGYRKVTGILEYGKDVSLKRKEDSSPTYFDELIGADDAIEVRGFRDVNEQYRWVADQIENDIVEEELDYDDILVIFPDAYYSKSEYMEFRRFLLSKNIKSNLAGITTDRDTFRVDDTVTCAHIYRAKGNEAPKVYVVNSEHCARGSEMIRLRNTLFTAITRSRAWVKICGVGQEMNIIKSEIEECIRRDYKLEFKIPTIQELDRMRLIHGDKTEEDKKKINRANSSINELIELVEKGLVDPSTMPQLQALLNTLRAKEDEDEFEE